MTVFRLGFFTEGRYKHRECFGSWQAAWLQVTSSVEACIRPNATATAGRVDVNLGSGLSLGLGFRALGLGNIGCGLTAD